VLGPDDGPVRLFVSADPKERLRVSNANCALDSVLQAELYGSRGAIERVHKIVSEGAARAGFLRAGKRDWFNMTAPAMLSAIQRTAQRCSVSFLTREEKAALIQTEVARTLQKLTKRDPMGGGSARPYAKAAASRR